jgi:plastocyanin
MRHGPAARRHRAGLLCAAIVSLVLPAGCRGKHEALERRAIVSGSLPPAPVYREVAVSSAGSLEGVVRLRGLPPPESPPEDPCSASRAVPLVKTGLDGALADTVVFLPEIPEGESFPASSRTLLIETSGCRFVPHVSAAAVGASVEILNRDAVGHHPHAYYGLTTSAFEDGLPMRGMMARETLGRPGVMALRCDRHPGMSAYIYVMANPYYAVTGPDGRFVLSGIPAGRYRAVAWHEAYGIREAWVKVSAGGKTRLDFEF